MLDAFSNSVAQFVQQAADEEKMIASETRYRRLFETAKDGILILDAKTGMIVDANPFLLEMLGYSKAQLNEKKIWELGFLRDIIPSHDKFLELQREEYVRYEDLPLEAADGRRKDVEFVSNVYLVGNNKVIQCNIRDITGRKKLESQLRQSQKLESIGRLAGGVAHDFNNFLTVINGYSHILLKEIPPSTPAYASIQEINMAGQRSADIVRQLLAFARRQVISPKVLNINDAIEGILKMLRRLIGEDIELLWKPAANLWPIKMDTSQLDQILTNLLVNSRDAISGVGTVIIETAKAEIDEAYCQIHQDFVVGEYIVLTVSDTGCGMDKETCEHIFEPFFTTKKTGEGTGLGLATVFGIVKQNDGLINVYSEPGKGTTTKIFLPRHVQETVGNSEKSTKTEIMRGTETVLLVEDEKALLQLAKTQIEGLGYTVLCSNSPLQAIKLADEYVGDIHLLITDVIMPEMNGRDMQKRISDLRPGIKCLFMSGYTADIIAHKGFLEEGIHFLQKSFTEEELAVKIRKALNDRNSEHKNGS